MLRGLFLFGLSVVSAGAWADALDLNLSNNVAQFQYSTASGVGAQGSSAVHMGVLYNSANSVMANAGLLVVNRQDGAPGLSVGVGIEGLVATVKDVPALRGSGSAMALNGEFRFSPPAANLLGFVLDFHYAPKIISFGSVTRYSQSGVRMEYEISPQTLVYVGYRYLMFSMKNGDNVPIDNGGHVGLKLAF